MIYILTSGEYSHYTIEGVYEGKEGLDLNQLRKDLIKSGMSQRTGPRVEDIEKFTRSGKLQEIATKKSKKGCWLMETRIN